MKHSFSNYHLNCDNTNDIIKFCKKLHTQLIEAGIVEKIQSSISLAFTNLHFLLELEPIVPLVQRYNINLISSFRIRTKEGVELTILNPKQTAKEIAKDLELDRTLRLLLILDELARNHLLVFDYDELDKQKELRFINEYDLAKLIFERIQTHKKLYKQLDIKTISDVYEKILKDLYKLIPMELVGYETIMSKISGIETIYLTNPNSNVPFIADERIDGIIYNPFTSRDIITFAEEQRKDILFGTGEHI